MGAPGGAILRGQDTKIKRTTQEIALAVRGERTPVTRTRNFPGLIPLADPASRASSCNTRDFAGAPQHCA
jgi:hypothetical protein